MEIVRENVANGLPEVVSMLHEKIYGEVFPYSSYRKKCSEHEIFVLVMYEHNVPIGYSMVVNHQEAEDLFVWQCGFVWDFLLYDCCLPTLFDEIVSIAIKAGYKSISFTTTNEHPSMLKFLIDYGFDIVYVKDRSFCEGNKLYLKYFIHGPYEMTVQLHDDNGRRMSIHRIEALLTKLYKENCTKVTFIGVDEEKDKVLCEYASVCCCNFHRVMELDFVYSKE